MYYEIKKDGKRNILTMEKKKKYWYANQSCESNGETEVRMKSESGMESSSRTVLRRKGTGMAYFICHHG